MSKPARILVVDDNETNRDILVTRLEKHGYQTLQAADGEEALASAKQHLPDLLLLDVEMPKLDGFEVCRRLKNDPAMPYIPIILCTARAASQDVVAGLDAGADEYLTKPIDQAALVARVRSMLRIKELHDQVQAQTKDLAAWNQTLEERVNEQVGELDRMNRLKGFLSPQIAKLVVSSGDGKLLESHRRDIAVVFCDLRGFTAFAERSRAGRYHRRVAGVLPLSRRMHRSLRGHAATLCRRRRSDHLQRSDTMLRSAATRRAHGGPDARSRDGAGGKMAPPRP